MGLFGYTSWFSDGFVLGRSIARLLGVIWIVDLNCSWLADGIADASDALSGASVIANNESLVASKPQSLRRAKGQPIIQ